MSMYWGEDLIRLSNVLSTNSTPRLNIDIVVFAHPVVIPPCSLHVWKGRVAASCPPMAAVQLGGAADESSSFG
jgi:hypothetical protein